MCGQSNPISQEDKNRLDELHLDKIDLSTHVCVINKEGYIGSSTQRELAYAILRNKDLLWYDPPKGEAYLQANAKLLGILIAKMAQE